MKKIIPFVFFVIYPLFTIAYDFEVNNIYYLIYPYIEKSVIVVYRSESDFDAYSNGSYAGDIVIPKSVTYEGETYDVVGIGAQAFDNSKRLTSVTLPISLQYIGREAFKNCNITSLDIPDNVTSIAINALDGCRWLTELRIGRSIKGIGTFAFAGCEHLRDIYCYAETPPAINTYYGGLVSKATLHVLSGSIESYRTSWYFKKIVPVENEEILAHYDSLLVSAKTELATARESDAFDFFDEEDDILQAIIDEQSDLSSYQIGETEYNALKQAYDAFMVKMHDIIDSIENVSENIVPNLFSISIYDPFGLCIKKPQKGINIIRYSDGTTRKVLVK